MKIGVREWNRVMDLAAELAIARMVVGRAWTEEQAAAAEIMEVIASDFRKMKVDETYLPRMVDLEIKP